MSSSHQTILLTGATGMVGSWISELLHTKKIKVKAIYNQNKQNDKNFEWIKMDLNGPIPDLAPVLENVDIVIHNAACLHQGLTQDELSEIQKVNVDFTKRLFNDAAQCQVRKIIFTSSFSMVKKPLPELIDENVNPEPLTPYAISKYIGEQILQEVSSKYKVNYSILRLSSPVNFNLKLMHRTVLKNWILKSMKGESIQVFGKGNRTQDFVAVSDIAKAFYSCIQKESINGIFNIASGNSISMVKLARLITTKFRNKYEFSGIDENENDRWNISIDKAKRHLNYNPEYTSESVISTLLEQTHVI